MEAERVRRINRREYPRSRSTKLLSRSDPGVTSEDDTGEERSSEVGTVVDNLYLGRNVESSIHTGLASTYVLRPSKIRPWISELGRRSEYWERPRTIPRIRSVNLRLGKKTSYESELRRWTRPELSPRELEFRSSRKKGVQEFRHAARWGESKSSFVLKNTGARAEYLYYEALLKELDLNKIRRKGLRGDEVIGTGARSRSKRTCG